MKLCAHQCSALRCVVSASAGRHCRAVHHPAAIAATNHPLVFVQEFDAVLDELDALATRLDSEWRVPCGRQHSLMVGVDTMLAIVPVVGSLALLGVSGHIVHFGYSMGLPRWRLSLMTWNAGVEVVFSEIPLLGTLLTSLYKGNRRNANHILKHFGRIGLGLGSSSSRTRSSSSSTGEQSALTAATAVQDQHGRGGQNEPTGATSE